MGSVKLQSAHRRISSGILTVFRRYTRQVILLTALGFFGGLLEAIGINALIPIFSFVSGNGTAATGVVSQIIEKIFHFVGVEAHLRYLLIFLCIMFIAKAIIQVITSYIKFKITFDYEFTTRRVLLKKTLGAKWLYLLQQKIGYLESTVMNDVHHAGLFFQQAGSILTVIGSLTMYVVAALAIAWQITGITVFIGMLLFIIFRPLIRKKRVYAKRMVGIRKQVAHFVNEHIIGMKMIKSLGTSEPVLKRGNTFFHEVHVVGLKSVLLSNVIIALMQPVSLLFIVALFAYSYTSPQFHFGAFAAVIYLVHRIFSYVEQLQSNIQKMHDAYPYLEHVLAYEEEIDAEQEGNSGQLPFLFSNVLAFSHVRFAYPSIHKEVIRDLTTSFARGSLTGIIGASGAGKTTMVDLILRLLSPTQGEILLDGKRIEDIRLDEWRKQVGYVSQDIVLFNDTIAHNITMYDETISKEAVTEAAKAADIYSFIQSNPQGFDTMVGERGTQLSVGQRQRIAIARVLARKPQLLILDEATSALDTESEVRIQEVIERLKGNMTIILIAHRLSTVMACDRLVVLENGVIREEGAPKVLLADPSSYFYKVHSLKS